MGLCRVDTDRLRGLASRLGTMAVALEDAAPAAALLAGHGYASEAGSVGVRLVSTDAWLAAWASSLDQRADLLDADNPLLAVPAWSTKELLIRRSTNAVLATHLPPPHLMADAAEADATDAERSLHRLVAAGAPAREIADSIAGLGPASVARLAAGAPNLVGGLGGAPADVRILANAVRLDMAREAVAAAMAEANGSESLRLAEELAALDELAVGARKFLVFDWANGRIIEWIGSPDAAHIAVYLPGAGIDRLRFSEVADRVAAMVHLDPTGGDLAVLAALAYETPPTIAHAALGGYADRGGPELIELLTGIDLAGRHVSLVGHSYGSVVIGEALQLGLAEQLAADLDVVVLGSPGVRADHVAELELDPQRFWAALLHGDEIGSAVHPAEILRIAACMTSGTTLVLDACAIGARLVHGTNPASTGFGGRVFGREQPAEVGAHSDYLATVVEDGIVTPSLVLRQLLLILVGRADDLPGATSSY